MTSPAGPSRLTTAAAIGVMLLVHALLFSAFHSRLAKHDHAADADYSVPVWIQDLPHANPQQSPPVRRTARPEHRKTAPGPQRTTVAEREAAVTEEAQPPAPRLGSAKEVVGRFIAAPAWQSTAPVAQLEKKPLDPVLQQTPLGTKLHRAIRPDCKDTIANTGLFAAIIVPITIVGDMAGKGCQW